MTYTAIINHKGACAYTWGSLEERFWSKVVPRDLDGCWEWLAGRSSRGYGAFSIDRVMRPAHRIAYILEYGDIPAGLEIDHLCRNPACVRPEHLEPVTPRENKMRGISPAAKAAVATHCLRGHPFDASNTFVDSRGFRHCRACGALRKRRAAQAAQEMKAQSA